MLQSNHLTNPQLFHVHAIGPEKQIMKYLKANQVQGYLQSKSTWG
jgi:hypothetical protein